MSAPIAWIIAGSDCGGGAGLQADLRTMAAWQVHGCTIVTAITAQNTNTVSSVHPCDPATVQQQCAALRHDLAPSVIKTGLLGSADIAETVASELKGLHCFVVVDPVLASGTGADFADHDLEDAYRSLVIPQADLLTPNLPECERLLARPVATPEDIVAAANEFLGWGAGSVLIKGGHGTGAEVLDYWTNGDQHMWLANRRLQSPAGHGTGCVLASCIAAQLALGTDLQDALVISKAWVRQGLRDWPAVGSGRHPVGVGTWPADPQDMPSCDLAELPSPSPGPFAEMAFPAFGLYPIVDRSHWVETLVELGVELIQLRAKDLTGSDLDREIEQSIQATQGSGCQLFINDHWESAIRHGAFGVHLGQDDLHPDALQHIARAGLRLGISTHSYKELAVAKWVQPSYVALGTLFRTSSKVMDYEPLGLDRLREMRQTIDIPLVAIGGIHLDVAESVRQAGADAMAVISEVTKAADLPAQIAAWKRFCAAGAG